MNYPERLERPERGQGGLSFLEVVVALAVLTSLVLAGSLVLVPVSRQARVEREVAVANSEAKRVLEKVQALPFKDLTTVYPPNREIIIGALCDGRVVTTYEDPASNPLVLRAVLTWNSPDLGAMRRTYYSVRTE